MLTNLGQNIRNGVIGSLAGGLAFGVFMTLLGMMSMVAMLVRSDSLAVGWLVHLTISTIFGVVYGLLLALLRLNPVATGLAWGVLAWVGGGLVLMPLFLGMPSMVLSFGGTTPWYSLAGHLLYGLVAGLVVWAIHGMAWPAGKQRTHA